MIKTLSLIKRRPDLERSAFRDHYEGTHAPLALPFMTGLVRYVRYHLEETLFGEPGFDVISAFWYRDSDATTKMMERLESEEGRPLREDELLFMDKPANRFFPVSERPLVEGEEGDSHVWVLVRKPEDVSRFDASARMVRDHWPRLEAGLGEVGYALLRDAFPVEGGALPYHSVLQLGASSTSSLPAWSESLQAYGYEVLAVRTRRHETALGGD